MSAFSSSSNECQNQFHFDPDKISLLKFSPNEHKNVFMCLGFVKKKNKKTKNPKNPKNKKSTGWGVCYLCI